MYFSFFLSASSPHPRCRHILTRKNMEVALTSREAGLGSLRHTLAYPWKRRFTSHLSLSSEINPVSIDLFFKPKIGKYEQLNLPERFVRLLLADLADLFLLLYYYNLVLFLPVLTF